jgi:hypothetical protein
MNLGKINRLCLENIFIGGDKKLKVRIENVPFEWTKRKKFLVFRKKNIH